MRTWMVEQDSIKVPKIVLLNKSKRKGGKDRKEFKLREKQEDEMSKTARERHKGCRR